MLSAFLMRDNPLFIDRINHAIMLLSEHGLVDRCIRRYADMRKLASIRAPTRNSGVKLTSWFMFVLVFCAVGWVLAGLVTMCERRATRKPTRTLAPNK